MATHAFLILLPLVAFAQSGVAESGGDAAALVQEAVHLQKPKLHVQLQSKKLESEAEVESEADVQVMHEIGITDDRHTAFRIAIDKLGQMKGVGNMLKVLAHETTFSKVMPLLHAGFNNSKFVNTMLAMAKAMKKNITDVQRFVDMDSDRVKNQCNASASHEAIVSVLKEFYTRQGQLTLGTAASLDSDLGSLVGSLPEETLAKVRGNVKYLVGGIERPFKQAATLYGKVVNAEPSEFCRELVLVLNATTTMQANFAPLLQQAEYAAQNLPLVVKGVVKGVALEHATKAVTEFASAIHSLYRYYDHSAHYTSLQVGNVAKKRLQCNFTA